MDNIKKIIRNTVWDGQRSLNTVVHKQISFRVSQKVFNLVRIEVSLSPENPNEPQVWKQINQAIRKQYDE